MNVVHVKEICFPRLPVTVVVVLLATQRYTLDVFLKKKKTPAFHNKVYISLPLIRCTSTWMMEKCTPAPIVEPDTSLTQELLLPTNTSPILSNHVNHYSEIQ